MKTGQDGRFFFASNWEPDLTPAAKPFRSFADVKPYNNSLKRARI